MVFKQAATREFGAGAGGGQLLPHAVRIVYAATVRTYTYDNMCLGSKDLFYIAGGYLFVFIPSLLYYYYCGGTASTGPCNSHRYDE